MKRSGKWVERHRFLLNTGCALHVPDDPVNAVIVSVESIKASIVSDEKKQYDARRYPYRQSQNVNGRVVLIP